MARYQFPQDRIALIVQDQPYQPALTPPRTTMQIYADPAASVLADIQNLDGSHINNATLYVEGGVIPEFLGPDGVVRVWAKIPGSSTPPRALYAQVVSTGGGIATGTTYMHSQTLAQTIWNVSHNLGRYPVAIGLFSADFSMQWDEFVVQHVDANNLIISMDTPTPGVALIG